MTAAGAGLRYRVTPGCEHMPIVVFFSQPFMLNPTQVVSRSHRRRS